MIMTYWTISMGKIIFKSQQLTITLTERFKDIVKSASARELENEMRAIVHTEILPLIDKGLSPVKGFRNFQKYKNPKKYPGDSKPSNKPNLRSAGKFEGQDHMLSHYKAKTSSVGGLSTTVGIHRDAPERAKMLAGVHNNGTQGNVKQARLGLKVLSKIKKKSSRDTKQKLKEKYNNELKGIPMRRFIPMQSEAETFTAKINSAVRKAFRYVIGRALKQGKGQK